MATLFAHAAAPLALRGAFVWPEGIARRLAWAAAICACVPDLDMVAFAFGVRPPLLLAHGGITHSVAFAAILALVVALLFFRSLGAWSLAWRRVAFFLFFATASHALLDLVTTGDVGIALFAPFSSVRMRAPFKLIPGAPLGPKELVGFWGILTVANELLYVVLPLLLAATWIAGRREAADEAALAKKRALRRAVLLGVAIFGARVALPEYFVATQPREIRSVGSVEAGDPKDIPRDGLPNGELLVRWDELESAGLFDRELRPDNAVWSSSFFPSWFGGESGRWSEGPLVLSWRTLTGFHPPSSQEAHAWLAAAARGDHAAETRLFTLAPTEKVDLVEGHFDFPATERSLSRSHNGHPRYWSGRCNGVAAASLEAPEPFRVVDVIGVDGERVRFHPNDVKALLAVAYYQTVERRDIGHFCDLIAFDAGATCSMNPAVLVLALQNRIGRAHRSFLVDALPTVASQFYAVAAARVSIVRAPYVPGKERHEAALDGKVATLADVVIDLTLSSTTLSDATANVVDPSSRDGSRYTKVGLRPVDVRYTATLALDERRVLIGGVWSGDPPDGPDDILATSGGPRLVDDKIPDDESIPWPLVRDLLRASVSEGDAIPTIDLRASGASGGGSTESRTP